MKHHPLINYASIKKGKTTNMHGLLEDWFGWEGGDALVQNVIDQNKDKAVAAATTQATNLVGSQLNKLTQTNPAASAAIASTVSQITGSASASALDSVNQWIANNKTTLMIYGGVGVAGLIGLWFIKGKLTKAK